MSARNTFVTSMIYDAAIISAVAEALAEHTDRVNFEGREDKAAGFFWGRWDTCYAPPYVELAEVLNRIDELSNGAYFDVAVVCDDCKFVISRDDLAKAGALYG